jgi:hypothetical protein
MDYNDELPTTSLNFYASYRAAEITWTTMITSINFYASYRVADITWATMMN